MGVVSHKVHRSPFPLSVVVILRLCNMTALDTTGIQALESHSDRLHRTGKTLLLCGARNQPSLLISRSDLLRHLGAGNVLPHVPAALGRARESHGAFEGIGRELAAKLEHRPLERLALFSKKAAWKNGSFMS
jgi:SulP family sulfate permease